VNDFFNNALDQLLERRSGPLHLRFVLQPVIALILAVRAGLKDAATNESPYLWIAFREPSRRWECLRSGWKDIGTVFVVALAIDVTYQIVVLSTVHPVQALIVALGLSIVPYIAVRGPTTRFARRRGVLIAGVKHHAD
jgi:hypothetical protein